MIKLITALMMITACSSDNPLSLKTEEPPELLIEHSSSEETYTIEMDGEKLSKEEAGQEMYKRLDDTSEIGGDLAFGTRDHRYWIRMKNDGGFFVKGKLITKDIEIYKAMKEFLKIALPESRRIHCNQEEE